MLLSRASSLIASALPIASSTLGVVSYAAAADTSAVATTAEPRVVLVTRSQDSEVVTLLRAELRALGFEVLAVAPRDDDLAPSDLNQLARNQRAVAAFRVSVTPNRVEVWVADRVTGKVTLREVIRRQEGEPFSARIAVLRAVELLRWSLQELQAPYPARGEIAEPPAEVENLANTPSSERLASAGAAAYAQLLPGTDRLALGLQVSASLRFGAWGGRLLFGQPLLPNRVSTRAGDVEADVTWVGGEFTWDALPLQSRWQLGMGLGVRVFSSELTGVVDEPLVGTSTQYYSVAPSFHSLFAVRLLANLHAFADVSFAYSTGETRVTLAGDSVATLHTGLGTLGAGLLLATD